MNILFNIIILFNLIILSNSFLYSNIKNIKSFNRITSSISSTSISSSISSSTISSSLSSSISNTNTNVPISPRKTINIIPNSNKFHPIERIFLIANGNLQKMLRYFYLFINLYKYLF